MERLLEGIQYIKGVGPKRSQDLHRLDVENILDLLWFVPRAYFNRSKVNLIAELPLDETVNIRGMVISTKQNRTGRGFNIFKASVEDESGTVTATWFNQAFLANIIKSGQEIFLTGKVKNNYGVQELQVSEYEILDGDDLEAAVLPIYPLTGGLTQKVMRKIIFGILHQYLQYYPEILAEEIREQYKLCKIDFALQNIHFPESGPAYLQARKRLAFEELLLFKLSIMKQKVSDIQDLRCTVHTEKSDLVKKVKQGLGFELTNAQQKVIREIFNDMESNHRMNRLLQGDVGSGKTAVAALALAKAAASGYQAVLMAPTEILAGQHFSSMQKFFADTGIITALLTGATNQGEKRTILEASASGEVDIIIGTHALIQDEVKFNHLGLVIIDEQHRFGVRQRAVLSQKGETPDVLVMTATPIPRTLALTVYGDLDLSVIDEMPPGRQPVLTRFITRSERNQAYEFARKQMNYGAQVYVVCPLVEESEKQDLQAAITLYDELRNQVFPDFQLGLIYGRMNSKEKNQVMQNFKNGQIQMLISTTVIEVGVDVPNASVMIIEHAERFGLSQLHQLRGRVGRGDQQAYCLLIGEARTEEARRRLKAMEKSNDGFELANEDLSIRGPGDFWGVKQHGLTELKVASLIKDVDLITFSSKAAMQLDKTILNSQLLSIYINSKFKKTEDIARN